MHQHFELIRDMGWATKQLMLRGDDRDSAIKKVTQLFIDELSTRSGDPLLFTAIQGSSLGLAWCDCGFPVVEMGQRLGASLMATKWNKDVASNLELPWRCFVVHYPGLIDFEYTMVLHTMTDRIFTMHIGKWLDSGDDCDSIEYLAEDCETGETLFRNLMEEGDMNKTHNSRQRTLINRMVLGTCAELTGFLGRPPVASKCTGYKSSKKRSAAPRVWSIRLSRPVKVDVRREISEYASSECKRKSPSTQCCVCGHWKWQRFGVGRLEKKWIHIEPYWRGPEDAPIAVRSHLMK